MSTIQESIKMYTPSSLGAFMFSSVLFILYSIINLIDMNEFILSFNITDINTYNRGKMIYSYLGGYFNCIIKILLSLFVIYILTLIVRITVSTILRVVIEKVEPSQQGGGIKTGGAAAIQKGASDKSMTRIEEALISNMRFILGFMINVSFIMLFLITIPLFLLIALFAYSQFYNKTNILDNNPEQASRILLTHHNFLLFLICSLFLITFIYTIFLWFKKTYPK